MDLLDTFLRFLYIGLFTVGGGLASIPLMLQVIVGAGYISEEMFYNMIAISESTPGPIGVNLATYIGFERHGVLGGIVTTLGIILPCFAISCVVARAFRRVSETPLIQSAFYGIRGVVVGLIATAAWGVLSITVFNMDALGQGGSLAAFVNWKALLVFAALLFLLTKFKKHPVFTILLGAAAGLLLF